MLLRFLSAAALVVALLSSTSAPAVAAAPIEAYGKLPGIDLMSLSPSGQRFAFVAVDGDKRKVFVRNVSGEALIAAPIGNLKVRALDWAGYDHLLITVTEAIGLDWRAESWRAEIGAVVAVDLKTGKSFRVFEGQMGGAFAVAGYYGSAQIDGKWYGYFAGIGPYDLFRVDLETGRTSTLSQSGFRGAGWVMDGKGAVIARSFYDPVKKLRQVFAGPDGRRLVFEAPSALGEVQTLGQGRSPGTVLVLDQSGDRDRTLEVDLSGMKKPETLFSGSAVHSFIVDPSTNLVLGARLEGGDFKFLDPKLQTRMDSVKRAFPGLHVTLASFDSAFDRVIVFTDGGDDAGTYWMVDLKSGKATELDEAYPAIRSADVGPTRMFAYKAADGLAMEGVLTLPPGREVKNLPLVVLPHGGPIGVHDEVGFDWWAQAFAARGYAVFQPNYRGSGGYGAAFRNAAMGEWGRKMQTDISDGVAALAARGIVDPKRACIVGGSYGGYAALAGVTLQHGLYRCAVSYGGVFDPATLLFNEGDRGGYSDDPDVNFERKLFRAKWAGDASMDQISPLRQASKADAPVLLIHGKDDSVVPIQQSEAMQAALSNAHKPVEFIRLDGEDHWLSREKTRTAMLQAAIGFVEKHNPPN